jgi:hypothetical protein
MASNVSKVVNCSLLAVYCLRVSDVLESAVSPCYTGAVTMKTEPHVTYPVGAAEGRLPRCHSVVPQYIGRLRTRRFIIKFQYEEL